MRWRHFSSRDKKTFTLIEMLIVIVIIGILAAALIPRLQSVQGRARDTKRKVDLKSIYNGTQIFLTDVGTYPLPSNAASGTCAYNTSCNVLSWNTASWLTTLTGILTTIPTDPLNVVADGSVGGGPRLTGNYVYRYGHVKNTPNTYDLTAQLENQNDPDRCGVKLYRYWLGA